ncbi:hypothetical protein P153DRAFT_272050, partial [Dothidotthia symphoricarpi CBS 119687]
PPPGDGKTLLTPAWAPSLRLNPAMHQTYIVDGLGLLPRYFRTTLVDARSWAQLYDIYDGKTYQQVMQLPPGPMINSTLPTTSTEAQQIAGIVAAENALAADHGAAAQQYNAAQVH